MYNIGYVVLLELVEACEKELARYTRGIYSLTLVEITHFVRGIHCP